MASVIKNTPVCKCGNRMVLRTARQGPHEGRQFWGCSDYPNCKEIRSYDPNWIDSMGKPEKEVINAAFGKVGESAKKVYEKPEIVDIEKLISENFKLFRETAEHVARERCPLGCNVIVDKVTDKDSPRVRALVVFSFKLGEWTFEHQKVRILWDPNETCFGSMSSRAIDPKRLALSLNLVFDLAARDLMKFHSRKEAGR